MSVMRALLMRHRALALLVVMAALCMKIIVPTGFMIGQNSKVLTIQLCHDGLGGVITKQLVIPMKDGGDESGQKQGKGECPFAALSMASLAGADLSLLALALAFILALGFAPTRINFPKRVSHLRPPLRGPPALA
ncbi:MAG: hypothetical protein EPO45_18135 [Sphingobium sp.]|jgi:hypothetical protein|nr:hypothetical protein [Sphingobium sp.]MBS88080.1 hypothetical protein [Sphingobium sp.]TAJ73789.1 MAG: hypothetical protein EPO45_18135 [Sphingobium sp.]